MFFPIMQLIYSPLVISFKRKRCHVIDNLLNQKLFSSNLGGNFRSFKRNVIEWFWAIKYLPYKKKFSKSSFHKNLVLQDCLHQYIFIVRNIILNLLELIYLMEYFQIQYRTISEKKNKYFIPS